MIINLWRIWDIWFEAMGRSQDFSAPWRIATGTRPVAAAGAARREVGPYESLCAGK
jgi:hypothetical protein